MHRLAALVLAGAAAWGAGEASASAPSCNAAARERALAPATTPNEAVRLTCSLRLGPGDVVSKRLVLEGRAASGVIVSCEGGGRIGRSDAPPSFPHATIEIRSAATERDGGPAWDRPADIAIRGCEVMGPIRIWGMGINGQGEAVKLSSRSLGHTERAQAAAPTRVSIEGATLSAAGSTPLYLGPGVTEVALTRSRVIGRANAIAVYLDAESARNTIAGTSFDIETSREVIAVDGSARNRIVDNTFRIAWRGGIYLYRNCGEGGTIRHQTPSDNVITGNRFTYAWPIHLPSVYVGAREGWRRLYCWDDNGYPFGSSADNNDNATGNVVEGNVVE